MARPLLLNTGKVHACGVPCDLNFDGQGRCEGVCVHDW